MYQTAGDVLLKHNMFDCSYAYYTNAYNIRMNMSGDSRVHEGNYYHSIGILSLQKDEYNMAMSFFPKITLHEKQSLGEWHEKIADTLVNIGQTYKHFLLYEEALNCCSEAISIYETELGLQNEKVANLLYNIT